MPKLQSAGRGVQGGGLPTLRYVQPSFRASLPALRGENRSEGTVGEGSLRRMGPCAPVGLASRGHRRSVRTGGQQLLGKRCDHDGDRCAGPWPFTTRAVSWPCSRSCRLRPATRSSGWLDRYPFPALPDGSDPAPYPPKLLPGERFLTYSCPQGLLVLDLWSCPGLSAKDHGPQYRLIRCQRRSLAAAPIPLDESRIGLLTRDGTSDGHFRWTVWDLSNKTLTDAELSSRLDSRETKISRIFRGYARAAELSWLTTD